MPEDQKVESAASGAVDPRIIVISQPSTKESSSGVKLFEQIVNLMKVLIWPLSLAAFLLVYRDTANQISEQLPGMMAHATKVSAGGLAIEIQEQAQQSGGTQLSNAVSSLNAADIQELLKTGCGWWGLIGTGGKPNVYTFPAGLERDTLLSLESHGLVSFRVRGEPTKFKSIEKEVAKFRVDKDPAFTDSNRVEFITPDPLSEDLKALISAEYKLTPLGRDAFNSVLAAVTAQLPGTRKVQPFGCATDKLGP